MVDRNSSDLDQVILVWAHTMSGRKGKDGDRLIMSLCFYVTLLVYMSAIVFFFLDGKSYWFYSAVDNNKGKIDARSSAKTISCVANT